MIKKDSLVLDLKNAYRKWKSAIYYDKYLLIDVDRLALFERKNNLLDDDSYFNDLANKLMDEDIRKTLFESIYGKIKLRCFPKEYSIYENNRNGFNKIKKRIITNEYNPEDEIIESFNYWIDLPVEAHILGGLWVLKIWYFVRCNI